MSVLAFFPWFSVQTEIAIGRFRLLPFRKGGAGGEHQATAERVLGAFRVHGGAPIKTATLVSVDGLVLIDDLDESLVDELFTVSELVAFAGLSSRQFFNSMRYAGRDDFRLVVRSFSNSDKGPLVVSRRRDTASSAHYAGQTFEIRCPTHVGGGARVIDEALLRAMSAAKDQPEWPRFVRAVTLFNEANTDRDNVPEVAELVLTWAAIEQLLECYAEPRRLSELFEEIWQPSTPIRPAESKILSRSANPRPRTERRASLRGVWIEQLGISRGSVAHGHDPDAYPSAWSAHEHLLYSAFVVPRLLKLSLAARGLYELSNSDLSEVDALEGLLDARHFANEMHHGPRWSEVLSLASMSRHIASSQGWAEARGEESPDA